MLISIQLQKQSEPGYKNEFDQHLPSRHLSTMSLILNLIQKSLADHSLTSSAISPQPWVLPCFSTQFSRNRKQSRQVLSRQTRSISSSFSVTLKILRMLSTSLLLSDSVLFFYKICFRFQVQAFRCSCQEDRLAFKIKRFWIRGRLYFKAKDREVSFERVSSKVSCQQCIYFLTNGKDQYSSFSKLWTKDSKFEDLYSFQQAFSNFSTSFSDRVTPPRMDWQILFLMVCSGLGWVLLGSGLRISTVGSLDQIYECRIRVMVRVHFSLYVFSFSYPVIETIDLFTFSSPSLSYYLTMGPISQTGFSILGLNPRKRSASYPYIMPSLQTRIFCSECLVLYSTLEWVRQYLSRSMGALGGASWGGHHHSFRDVRQVPAWVIAWLVSYCMVGG